MCTLNKKRLCILIDPGHGIETKGKRSPDSRLLEYKWNREFADLLKIRLSQRGISSIIIVDDEKDLSLGNRCLRANTITKNFKSNGVDTLYISIHVDAGPGNGWSTASGVSVYVYENGSEKSVSCGKIYTGCAKDRALTGNRSIPEDGYWKCRFYVLKNTTCPAVLVEHKFMTNREDVEYLLSPEGKEELIDWHIDSILEYMKKYNYTV